MYFQKIYFDVNRCPNTGKLKSMGMLFDGYRNKIRTGKFIMKNQPEKKTREEYLRESIVATQESEEEEEKMVHFKNWLRHHIEPIHEINYKWKASFKLRRRELLQKIIKIPQDWPLLTKSNAKFFVSFVSLILLFCYVLFLFYSIRFDFDFYVKFNYFILLFVVLNLQIDLDFAQTYPQQSENFINKWSAMKINLFNFISTRVKDELNSKLYKEAASYMAINNGG